MMFKLFKLEFGPGTELFADSSSLGKFTKPLRESRINTLWSVVEDCEHVPIFTSPKPDCRGDTTRELPAVELTSSPFAEPPLRSMV